MIRKLIAGTTLFALVWFMIFVVILAQPGHTAPQCDSRENVTGLLADRYGETIQMAGLAGEAAVMEVYANRETGTWSITMTMPDGLMCLMSSGLNFEAVEGNQLPANL